MTWINAHWTDIITIWGVLWALATVLQSAFPPASVPYRICHAILAVSPLDFVKAIKSLGGALVPPMASLTLFFVIALSACAPKVDAKVPTVDPHTLARASVSLLEDAWKASAQSCLDLANAKHDDSIRASCEKTLTPARNALIAASSGVDLWSAADEKNFPCLVMTAAAGVSQVAGLAGIKVPMLVTDGLAMAETYAGRCAP